MLGVDIVEIGRVARALRSPRFKERVFSPNEIAFCERSGAPDEAFAGTLAAKEAVIKALELGSLARNARRIEVTRDANGAPRCVVDRRLSVTISISHASTHAIAVALVVTPSDSLTND